MGVIMWREVGREGGREGCEREGIKEDGESNRILCTVYLIKLNTGMYLIALYNYYQLKHM